jgi:hypothetical protein
MKPMKYFSSVLLTAILIAALFCSACKKDTPVAPELPPLELMMIDFSNFADPSDTLSSLKSMAGYSNWGAAFCRYLSGMHL